jgi:FkbM family methyltransferase
MDDYKAKYENYIFFCRTEGQAKNVKTGLNEPFRGDLDVIKEIIQLTKRNKTFIDIGSNIGTFSISCSKLFNKILAYEPQEDNYKLLEKNVKINNIDNINYQNYGILDIEGKFFLDNHDKTPGVHPGTYYIEPKKEGNIETKILSNELLKYGLESVDFIKIDTEGSELLILKSIEDILLKYKPNLCIELNSCSLKNYNIPTEEIKKYILSLGYKLFKINGSNYYFY